MQRSLDVMAAPFPAKTMRRIVLSDLPIWELADELDCEEEVIQGSQELYEQALETLGLAELDCRDPELPHEIRERKRNFVFGTNWFLEVAFGRKPDFLLNDHPMVNDLAWSFSDRFIEGRFGDGQVAIHAWLIEVGRLLRGYPDLRRDTSERNEASRA